MLQHVYAVGENERKMNIQRLMKVDEIITLNKLLGIPESY